MNRPSLPSFLTVLRGAAQPLLAASPASFRHSAPVASGYNVVSYHTGEKPLRGKGNQVATHEGVTYLFVSGENRKSSKRIPEEYVTPFGGDCAYGVAVGKRFVGDPDVRRVVDGRRYLNPGTKIQHKWFQDAPAPIRNAHRNWAEARDAEPASH